ncbi:MAG: hypothetical protein K0S53_385 [Bacteroidetes bacterium]|jgi:hypothetical protein|nr:hypothetical protein [Bacteroidota bacterium]
MTPKEKEFLRQLKDLFNPEPEENEIIKLAIILQLQKAYENQLLMQSDYKKHFNQITKSINPLTDNENI